MFFGKKKTFLREIIYSEKWKVYDAGKVSSTVQLGRVYLGWAFKHAYVKLFFFYQGWEWVAKTQQLMCNHRVILSCRLLYYFTEHFSEKLVFWVSCSSKFLIAAKWCTFCQEVEPFWCAFCLQILSVCIRRIWLDNLHMTQPWYYDA